MNDGVPHSPSVSWLARRGEWSRRRSRHGVRPVVRIDEVLGDVGARIHPHDQVRIGIICQVDQEYDPAPGGVLFHEIRELLVYRRERR